MSDWIEIGHIDEIPRLGSRVIKSKEGNIAIFRTAQDKVHALLDRCPHKGGPLSQGIVHGDQVTCPLRDWRIQLASGEAVAPDMGCAHNYRVRLKDGLIFLIVR